MGTRIIRGIALALAFTFVRGAAFGAEDKAAMARLAAALGDLKESEGDYDAALKDFTAALEAGSLPAGEQARILFARGVVQDQDGKDSQALADYSAAISLRPGFAEALNNRANLYRRMGRLAEAKADYLASLKGGNPAPEFPWYGLGLLAEATGDHDGALKAYRWALAANPAYRPAAERLAQWEEPVVASPDPIHLHLPNVTDSAPIVLKAPAVPLPRVARAQAPRAVRPALAPAKYAPEPAPQLRSSLDKAMGEGAQVQLGAWRSEVEAGMGWNRAVKEADGLLNGYSPHIVAADLPGKGRYYRLRVTVESGSPAALCQSLAVHGLDCLPTRN